MPVESDLVLYAVMKQIHIFQLVIKNKQSPILYLAKTVAFVGHGT